MNLIWFLTIGTVFLGVLGEFGQFPFGSTNSVSILDIGSIVTIGLYWIWQIGIKRKFEIPRAYWYLVGFGLSGLIGSIMLGEYSGVNYLLRFIVYSMWVLVGAGLIGSKHIKISDWYKLLLYVGTFIVIGGVGQMIWLPDLKLLGTFGFDSHLNRMTGFFLDPNFFGAILSIIFVVGVQTFFEKKDWKVMVLLGILAAAIVMSFSRSAYLMLFVMMALFGFWRSKKILLMVAVVATMLFLVVPRFGERIIGGIRGDASANERIESWQKGISLWNINPVFGIGFDNIRVVSERRGWIKVYSGDGGNSGSGVDSSLLFILATTGVVGLGFFGAFWITVIRKCWRLKEINGIFLIVIIGLLIESWFVNSLFYPLVMMFLYLWAGVILAREKR